MNKNFIKQDQYGINFQYSRNQASPLDPHSVITSYSDLTGDFLKQVNTYPGQLVALADDISNSSGITLSPNDRQHQGLYWVTNGDNAGKAIFTTYKLSTTYESNISYDRIWNTVKIAYTKTFEPWASYINAYVFNTINDLHNFAWNTIWPDVNFLRTYTSATLGAAVDALHKYTFKTVIPYEETTREMLMAMLPDMPYYKPKYSDFNFSYAENDGTDGTFTQTYSNNATYNYFCVEYGTYYAYIPQLNIKFNWKNTAPFVNADKALYTYIENNSKFPTNINLSHLGYTNLIGSQTREASGSFAAKWDFFVTLMPQSSNNVVTRYIYTKGDEYESSAPDAQISSIGKYTSTFSRLTQNDPYYFNIGNNPYQENTVMPLFDSGSTDGTSIDFSGMSTLVSLYANIYYSGPQKTFYDSLANKNIFIESTANMWDTDMYALKSNNVVNVSQFIQCYSGFRVYYGLFNLTSDVLNTGDNYKNIIKYIINGVTKPSSLNKSTVKNPLVTYASDSGLPRSLSTKYFGSSEMGVSEWGETTGRNCCFIGFPTNFFNYTQIDTSLHQVWEGKFSGTGSWGTFGAAGTDTQNYIINNVDITSSYGKTVNYTFVIAKTTLPFKFGASNSSGYGLRLTCQQTGLNHYNQDI